MEPRKKKSNSKKTLPDFSKSSLLDWIVWIVVTLAGTVASIVLLILFQRRRIKRPFAPREANGEPEPYVQSQPTVADDDPRIFSLRTFGYFTIFLVVLIGFVVIAGALLSGFYLPGRSVIITPAPTLLPPGPRLESYPGEEFPALHATQEAGLNSYGWVDRKKGIVHIPIEQAMEMIAKSNLPVATGTPVAATPFSP